MKNSRRCAPLGQRKVSKSCAATCGRRGGKEASPSRRRCWDYSRPARPPSSHSTTSDVPFGRKSRPSRVRRSEEHTSELQSPCNLVCRLLLEKKKKNMNLYYMIYLK